MKRSSWFHWVLAGFIVVSLNEHFITHKSFAYAESSKNTIAAKRQIAKKAAQRQRAKKNPNARSSIKKKIARVVLCRPFANLTLQGGGPIREITLTPGNPVDISWNSSCGIPLLSIEKQGNDTCVGRSIPTPSTLSALPLSKVSSKGGLTVSAQPCQVGSAYKVQFQVQGVSSVQTTEAMVRVAPIERGSPARAFTSFFGAYNWAGRYSELRPQPSSEVILKDGFDLLKTTNARIIRFPLSLGYDRVGSDGLIPTLETRSRIPLFDSIFQDPQYKTIMLTAYDRATIPNEGVLKFAQLRALTPQKLEEVSTEVYQLVSRLYADYGDLDKTIILSNWEGDNSVYCGELYSYLTSPSFRAGCDSQYATSYGGNSGPAETVEALRLWLRARQEGVNRARNLIRVLMPTARLRVLHIPEIASVHLLEQAGLPNLLHSVVGREKDYFDGTSYSAWESIASGVDTVSADIDTIRSFNGGKATIIGELGYECGSTPSSEAQCVSQLRDLLHLLNQKNITAGFLWGVSGSTTGIFRKDGSPRPGFLQLW